jgi:hypothetical protein
MEKELLSKYRSDVIEKFINIETIVNAIICQYYFKKVVMNFFFDVLYDEYFSFGFKRKILEKIIKEPNRKKIDDLNRLSNIRNYFVHRNQEIVENKPEAKAIIPDPKNTRKGIDFEGLYRELLIKEKEVTEYLADIFSKLGGVMENELPH